MFGIDVAINLVSNTTSFSKGLTDAGAGSFKFFESMNKQLSTMKKEFKISEEQVSSLSNKFINMMPKNLDANSTAYRILFSQIANDAQRATNDIKTSLSDMFGTGAVKDNKFTKDFKGLENILISTDEKTLHSLAASFNLLKGNIDKMTHKELKQFGDMFDDLKEHPEKIEQITKGAGKLANVLDKRTNKSLKEMVSGVGRFAKNALELYSIFEIFTQIIGVQNELARSTWKMGLSQNTVFKDLNGNVLKVNNATKDANKNVRNTTSSLMDINRQVAASTQSSLSEVSATMRGLMDMRVGTLNGDLAGLTETSVLMSKALGISGDAANRFVKDLSLIGGLAEGEIRDAAQAISNVQQQFGLTEVEAQGVGDTVGYLMRRFRTFGGSVKDIKVVTKEVAKMTAVFSSVGLEASEAGSMIKKMMDPENLSQSIMLWNQMGMSASEGMAMMNGQGGNMANMTEKMVVAAKNLKAQYGGNIFALKAMAEASGMTLESVQALSQYDSKKLKDQKDSLKLEQAANAARQGMLDQLNRIKDSLMVVLQGAILPFLKPIGDLLETIARGLSWINELAESQNLLVKGIGMALKGGILVALLMVTGVIPGIINGFAAIARGIPVIGKNIGTAASTLKDLGKSAWETSGKFIDGWRGAAKNGEGIFSQIGAAFKNAFGKKVEEQLPDAAAKGLDSAKDSAAEKAKDAIKKNAEINPEPLEKAGKAMNSFPSAGQILAIGGAILMIAVGIGAIALATAQLAKAMKDLNPEQLNALMGTMGIIMGGMVLIVLAFAGALAVLGAAGYVAAGPILAIGGAVFLMALGVSLIILSLTELVKAFAGLGENAGMVASGIVSIIGAVTSLMVVASGLGLVLMAMSGALISGAYGMAIFSAASLLLVGSFLLLSGVVGIVEKIGNTFLNMGAGIDLITGNISSATKGLLEFKNELGGGWKGIADGIVAEIGRVNAELDNMQNLLSGVNLKAAISQVVKVVGGDKTEASSKPVDYTSQLDIANKHLGDISSNTATTNTKLDGVINAIKSTRYNVTSKLVMNNA